MFGSHLACHFCSRSDMMQRIELVWPLTFLSVCHCFSGAHGKQSLACLSLFGASAWAITNQINVNGVLFPRCTACLEPWNLGAIFFVNVPCGCTRPPPFSVIILPWLLLPLFSIFRFIFLKMLTYNTRFEPSTFRRGRSWSPYIIGRWQLLSNFSFSFFQVKRGPPLYTVCGFGESVIVCLLWICPGCLLKLRILGWDAAFSFLTLVQQWVVDSNFL